MCLERDSGLVNPNPARGTSPNQPVPKVTTRNLEGLQDSKLVTVSQTSACGIHKQKGLRRDLRPPVLPKVLPQVP